MVRSRLVFNRFLSDVLIVPFLIMGRVTYIHHYLPTLYFAVLMVGHLFDHFIFKSRKLKDNTKWVIFAIAAGTVIGVFWWFRGVAFGIDGPIKEHKGLLWRKVRISFEYFERSLMFCYRAGISMKATDPYKHIDSISLRLSAHFILSHSPFSLFPFLWTCLLKIVRAQLWPMVKVECPSLGLQYIMASQTIIDLV